MLLVVCICSVEAVCQATVLGANCDLAMIGGTDKSGFLQFDREFRYALSNRDAGVMAMLVSPSLRVNDKLGPYYLKDTGSLELRFEEVFPAKLRQLVLKERPEELACVSSGLMYGAGSVWVQFIGQRYAITSVNVPSPPDRTKSSSTVEFVCDADKHRVIVDTSGDAILRYRAWSKPRSLLDKPDLQILGGKRGSEGSGSCRYTTWTFTRDGVNYSLDGPGGCFEQGHEPPSDSNGSLTVMIPGKADTSWWCR
jgi:hypothetical protein